MKVKELIEQLKEMPQNMDVFVPSTNSSWDYAPILLAPKIYKSVFISDDTDENEFDSPRKCEDICVIGEAP